MTRASGQDGCCPVTTLSAWAEPPGDDPAREVGFPVAEPVRVMEEFPVVSIRKTRHGKWLYDMGQNFGDVSWKSAANAGRALNTTELFNFECDLDYRMRRLPR